MPSSKFLSRVTHLSAHVGGGGGGGDGDDNDNDNNNNNNNNAQSPPCYIHSHALISTTLHMPYSLNAFCRTKNKNFLVSERYSFTSAKPL